MGARLLRDCSVVNGRKSSVHRSEILGGSVGIAGIERGVHLLTAVEQLRAQLTLREFVPADRLDRRNRLPSRIELRAADRRLSLFSELCQHCVYVAGQISGHRRCKVCTVITVVLNAQRKTRHKPQTTVMIASEMH